MNAFMLFDLMAFFGGGALARHLSGAFGFHGVLAFLAGAIIALFLNRLAVLVVTGILTGPWGMPPCRTGTCREVSLKAHGYQLEKWQSGANLYRCGCGFRYERRDREVWEIDETCGRTLHARGQLFWWRRMRRV